MRRNSLMLLTGLTAPLFAANVASAEGDRSNIEHVLLLSIDGLHEQDLARFIEKHPRSSLAELAHHGVQYTNAWVNRLDGFPTNPSDSFPGLLALITGGSSKTHGGWYDVSYTRDLYPASSNCTGTPGTAVAYDETIEKTTPSSGETTATTPLPTRRR